ncbi:MAG: FMN-binding protein [Candidatus Omnitrophota bacterium]|nr:FMN-binding protein [Candidatus Omnitrophota bacterium]
MKKWIISIVVLVLLGLGAFAGYMFYSEKQVMNMEIGDVDLSRVPDGEYKGKCDYMIFTCRAEVSVRNHRITGIKLFEDRDSKWVEQAKGVARDVLREQSLKVDTVTGATITSKAFLKAIRNALTKTK